MYLTAMLAISLASSQGYESPDTVIANMREASALSQRWSGMWLAEPNRECTGATIRRSEDVSNEIRRVAVNAAGTLNNPRMGDTSKWWAGRVVDGVAPIAAASQLALGNAYLRGQCLDQADRVFRDVMITFTGPQYQSLARVGIDDVREARRSAQPHSEQQVD